MRIELKKLCKSFNDAPPVLSNIDFEDDISTLALIGPSGGGKSTLLRIIGGLLSPTSGSLVVDGSEVLQDERHLIAYRRKLGFVFQQNGLFQHLSAIENISTPLRIVHGYSDKEADTKAKELLERFGLLSDGHKKPSALSGGQQQRVAIARAIAPNPKLLLLDEPTSALDPEYTTEVLDIVNALRQDGIRFIIVTHEMGFARRACDKAIFLCAGQITEYGESSALFSEPKTAELKQFLSKLLEWNA